MIKQSLKQYFIYILTNYSNRVLYIGITNNLVKRVYEHKSKLVDGFTKKYNVTKLVYFEMADDPFVAITREKQIKHWRRSWKLELIKKVNPDFSDLYSSIGHP